MLIRLNGDLWGRRTSLPVRGRRPRERRVGRKPDFRIVVLQVRTERAQGPACDTAFVPIESAPGRSRLLMMRGASGLLTALRTSTASSGGGAGSPGFSPNAGERLGGESRMQLVGAILGERCETHQQVAVNGSRKSRRPAAGGSAEARPAGTHADERLRRRESQPEAASTALIGGTLTLQQELGSPLLPGLDGVVHHAHDLLRHRPAPSPRTLPLWACASVS